MSRRFWRHFRDTFVAGLLLVMPLVVTYLILRLVFNFLKDLMDPFTSLGLFTFVPELARTWVALGMTVIILYLAGMLTRYALGTRLLTIASHLIEAIPVVGTIYRMSRQATEVLGGTGKQERLGQNVVIVDFPRKGMKTIGLVTGRSQGADGQPLLMLYVPTAPLPTSGFTALVPEAEVIATDMSVEDAMKLVMSGGVIFPDDLGRNAFKGGVSSEEVEEGKLGQSHRPSFLGS